MTGSDSWANSVIPTSASPLLTPPGPGQSAVGDNPGVGSTRHMGFEPVLAGATPSCGAWRASGSTARRSPDPGATRRAICHRPSAPSRALDRFDILTSDQRQQRHRLSRFGAQFLLGQIPPTAGGHRRPKHPTKPLAGLSVVPGDRRFARIVVIMGTAAGRPPLRRRAPVWQPDGSHRSTASPRPEGGHRIVEHRGIQRPPRLARQRPRRGDHGLDRLEELIGGRRRRANRRRQ